jgi:translocator protein
MNLKPERRHDRSRALSLIQFVVLVLGTRLLLGFLTTPGDWYGQLAKPDFNPPGWIFGPVWTVLYVMIALAGWRVWQMDRGGSPMKLWWAQLLLNFLWTPVFFGAHQISLALIVILLLLAAILSFIAKTSRLDRVAAWLFVPYAAWVAFASVLNASLVAMN